MVEVEEDPNVTETRILDFFCWRFATSAEMFYPPEEAAEETIEYLRESTDVEVDDELIGREKATCNQRMNEIFDFYEDMRMEGFNPRERAERYRQDNDLPEIDWTWHDEIFNE